MGVFRTKNTYDSYAKYIAEGNLGNGCNLCSAASVKEFEHWKILNNLFPWDNISKINHIIVPKRHVLYEELNEAEKKEFDSIKLGYIETEYEIIAEATNRKKSIPTHFHKHLLVLKDTL
jgi:hypothetical protein